MRNGYQSINNSKAEDERVRHLLDVWKSVANLKKAVAKYQAIERTTTNAYWS